MRIPRAIALLLALTVYACVQEAGSQPVLAQANATAAKFVVYKNPQCDCCNRWIEHMKDAGFESQVEEQVDLSGIKREFGIPPSQQSCHTAVWQNGRTRYVFEGHIPAKIVRQFLDNPPKNVRGLLVPGMPVGSPGMEYGDEHTPYDVLLLKSNGAIEVYAHVATK
jgi:hypothetical protein